MINKNIGVIGATFRKIRPVAPGLRNRVIVNRTGLYKGRPLKSLTVDLKKNHGINNMGRRTLRRCRGAKRLYRIIDFKREKVGKAVVQRIEYDPNRGCFIALIQYEDGIYNYILAPRDLKIGEFVESNSGGVEQKAGNTTILKNILPGTPVHNVEFCPSYGGKLARGAGESIEVISINKSTGYVVVKMPSRKLRLLHGNCKATIGVLSNPLHNMERGGKAGTMWWSGHRPIVRGISQNSCDHPMGGGKNNKHGPVKVSRTGVNARGGKTRRNKITTRFIKVKGWV